MRRLLVAVGRHKRVRNVRERRLELAAERSHDADDGDRDTGRDEAVLNGGRTRLVLRKLDESVHEHAPKVHTWLSERGTSHNRCFPADLDHGRK
jgi:hypothetical protein